MNHVTHILAVATLSASAFGQNQTWIVDAANGAGTNFIDLPPAVAASQPGDSIVVRAGDYTGVRVYHGISILGEPGARITNGGATYAGIIVSLVPAGETCAVSGFEILVINPLDGSMSAVNNAGNILFERNTTAGPTHVLDCANARIQGCTLANIEVTNTALSMSHTSGYGAGALFGTSKPAVRLTNSSTTLSRCSLDGFAAFGPTSSSAAISLAGGSLLLTGDGSGHVAAGTGQVRSAIDGNGTLTIDPHVALVPASGAPAIATSVNSFAQPIPSLRAIGAPAGGTVDIELFGETGAAYFMFVGYLTPPIPFAPWNGSIWLSSPLLFDSGIIDATERAGVQAAIPNSPLVYGYAFTVQALTASSSGVLLSNSSSYVHGS